MSFAQAHSRPAKRAAIPEAQPIGESPAAGVHVPPTGTEVVLIVDDDPAVRRLAREMLRVLGYRTVEAANSEQAVRTAAGYRDQIHLLLTDVVMPGPNGGALSAVLTARHPGLKVLLMSGHHQDPAVHRAIQNRAALFLPKPFSLAELAVTVRAVLDAA